MLVTIDYKHAIAVVLNSERKPSYYIYPGYGIKEFIPADDNINFGLMMHDPSSHKPLGHITVEEVEDEEFPFSNLEEKVIEQYYFNNLVTRIEIVLDRDYQMYTELYTEKDEFEYEGKPLSWLEHTFRLIEENLESQKVFKKLESDFNEMKKHLTDPIKYLPIEPPKKFGELLKIYPGYVTTI